MTGFSPRPEQALAKPRERIIMSGIPWRVFSRPRPSSITGDGSNEPIRQHDLVQIRPGYEPGFGLQPFVVERVVLGQVWGRFYDTGGSFPVTVPKAEVTRVGRLFWKMNGERNA